MVAMCGFYISCCAVNSCYQNLFTNCKVEFTSWRQLLLGETWLFWKTATLENKNGDVIWHHCLKLQTFSLKWRDGSIKNWLRVNGIKGRNTIQCMHHSFFFDNKRKNIYLQNYDAHSTIILGQSCTFNS